MVQTAHTFEGYSSDTFLLEIGSGVAVSSVKRYRLDIANALNQPNVRIGEELTVHEGKAYRVNRGRKESNIYSYVG